MFPKQLILGALKRKNTLMINITEHDEREFLEVIKEKLGWAVKQVDENVRRHSEELRQKSQYMHEHSSSMDEADIVAADQSINRMTTIGESTAARKRRLIKLSESPYFGRIDFVPSSSQRRDTGLYWYPFFPGRSVAEKSHLRLARSCVIHVLRL
jgi:DNA helicase-2/ATP-dependent DNA helicase PcrA